MSVQLDPYLSFDGTAREALEHYHSIFGGALHVSTFGEQPDMPGNDPSLHDKVMHGQLTGDNSIHLMAADAVPGMGEPTATKTSMSLSGDDESLLRGYWDALSADGSVTMPLEKAPWGDSFGMLVDKFGVPWMVNIAGSPQA